VTSICSFQVIALLSARAPQIASAPQRDAPAPAAPTAPAPAAAPAAPLPRAVALTTTSHAVADLNRTVAFYREVFGFDLIGGVAVGRPLVNSAMEKLTNTAGAKYRQASLRLPNTGLVLRLMEFSEIEHAAVPKSRFTDPGQTILRFFVSDGDMDAALANLRRAGAEIVVGGGPVARGGVLSLIVARDPDGYLLEVGRGQGAQATNTGAGASPVLDVHVVLTTADTDKKLAFYGGVLGFEVPAGTWTKMPTGTGEIRRSTSREAGGANRIFEICEYRNVGTSAPVQSRLQDPSTGLVSFIVRDLPDTLKPVKEAKLPVVTAGGEPVTLANLQRIVIRDPDGAAVELIQE
jgi:catechol 2,3-dioxygenase-like lactoylglutathione lyase family enzyme